MSSHVQREDIIVPLPRGNIHLTDDLGHSLQIVQAFHLCTQSVRIGVSPDFQQIVQVLFQQIHHWIPPEDRMKG